MPVNAASRSINLPDEIAKKHDVQFFVYSRLAVLDMEQLDHQLDDHLRFMKSLSDKGILPLSGPFFTQDGKKTGNGFYVLRLDNLEEGTPCCRPRPTPQSRNPDSQCRTLAASHRLTTI